MLVNQQSTINQADIVLNNRRRNENNNITIKYYSGGYYVMSCSSINHQPTPYEYGYCALLITNVDEIILLT